MISELARMLVCGDDQAVNEPFWAGRKPGLPYQCRACFYGAGFPLIFGNFRLLEPDLRGIPCSDSCFDGLTV